MNRWKDYHHPERAPLFTHMSQNLFPTVSKEVLDVELYVKAGSLMVSPLTRYYEDNLSGLALHLENKYGHNWQRLHMALVDEVYNIMITSSNTETRKLTRELSENEIRELINTATGTVKDDSERDATNRSTQKGTTTDAGDREQTDTETRNLTDETTDSGTESQATLGTVTNAGTKTEATNATLLATDNATITGSKSNTQTDDLSESTQASRNHELDKSNTDTVTGTLKVTDDKTTSGTSDTTSSARKENEETVTTSGSNNTTNKIAGVGGAGFRDESASDNTTSNTTNTTGLATESGTENVTDSQTEKGTANTTENKAVTSEGLDTTTESSNETKKNTGTVSTTEETNEETDGTKSEETTSSINTDTDQTETTDTTATTTFGKTTKQTGTGTLTIKTQATDNNTQTVDLIDEGTGAETGSNLQTRNLMDHADESRDQTISETVTEELTSEGSSPLRTFQALILEELELRQHNLVDVIVADVIREVCNKIWQQRKVRYL